MKTTKLSLFNRGGSLLAALTAYHVVVAIFVLTLVTGAGSLIGSNMGFKATRDYDFNSNVAAQNVFNVALPHNNPWLGQGVTKGFSGDSDFFLSEICNSTGGPFGNLTLTKYDNAAAGSITQQINTSCSSFLGTAFDFVEGESYTMGLSGANVTGIVLVGSQDPTYPPGGTNFVFNSNVAAANTFGVSITPNTKWASANDLLTGWCNGPGGPFGNLTLTKYDNAAAGSITQQINTSCSSFLGTDFPLVPFEGYSLGLAGVDVPRTQEPYY
jgi:hypothetical protein